MDKTKQTLSIFCFIFSIWNCTHNPPVNKDYIVKNLLNNEKGTLTVSSRKELEEFAINQLKRTGKYNPIEWEIEKTMIPSYGLVTYDPYLVTEVNSVEMNTSLFNYSCREKRDKKIADESGSVGDEGGLFILPVPGVIIIGITPGFRGNGSRNKTFFYFYCKPKTHLPDSVTISLKDIKGLTINKYLVLKNSEESSF